MKFFLALVATVALLSKCQGCPCSTTGLVGPAIPAYSSCGGLAAVDESLAESRLTAGIRSGAVAVVPPGVSNAAAFQSVSVPGNYASRVYQTNPLPPLVVSQPAVPVIQVSSGPAAVVGAPAVIYRQPPNVVVQNEIINQQPAPLSLNPVYVKVYKPGKRVIAPCPAGLVNSY